MWRGLLALLTLITKIRYGSATEFTVGYLTGSERPPGNDYYSRPGRDISGAITIAVEEVNEKFFNPLGHSLKFKVSSNSCIKCIFLFERSL